MLLIDLHPNSKHKQSRWSQKYTMFNLSWKFHENLFMCFAVILLLPSHKFFSSPTSPKYSRLSLVSCPTYPDVSCSCTISVHIYCILIFTSQLAFSWFKYFVFPFPTGRGLTLTIKKINRNKLELEIWIILTGTWSACIYHGRFLQHLHQFMIFFSPNLPATLLLRVMATSHPANQVSVQQWSQFSCCHFGAVDLENMNKICHWICICRWWNHWWQAILVVRGPFHKLFFPSYSN